MTAMLSSAERARLVKVLGLLSSDKLGERAAAGQIASQMLQGHGLTWNDLISPSLPHYPGSPYARACEPKPPSTSTSSWTAQIRFVLAHEHQLTPWERQFALSITTRSRLSEKQGEILVELVNRLRRADAG